MSPASIAVIDNIWETSLSYDMEVPDIRQTPLEKVFCEWHYPNEGVMPLQFRNVLFAHGQSEAEVAAALLSLQEQNDYLHLIKDLM
ncbi:MAG: hypothetical protein Q4E62_02415 [Sutterellaceae bacterium]|nr:hypothetical protein [Sutterellaceae bacterium]